MNRKRAIYVSSLMVTIAGFVGDRLFMGTPETADAASIPTASEPNPNATNASSANPSPQDAGDPVLEWLDQLPERQAARDIFSLSGKFLIYRQQQEAAKETEKQKESSTADLLAAFSVEHELQSTLVGPNGCLASVDGTVMRIGEQRGDFQLVRVDARLAEFRHLPSGEAITLFIKLPTP